MFTSCKHTKKSNGKQKIKNIRFTRKLAWKVIIENGQVSKRRQRQWRQRRVVDVDIKLPADAKTAEC